jgi:hypothetical protein
MGGRREDIWQLRMDRNNHRACGKRAALAVKAGPAGAETSLA